MKNMDTIRWQTAPYGKRGNGQFADICGSRLYVKRNGKGQRCFSGYINGFHVGYWDTLEMAMSQVAKIFRTNEEF